MITPHKAYSLFMNELMGSIEKLVEAYHDKKMGMALIVFDLEKMPDGTYASNYVSNCRREEMIQALRDTAQTLEDGLDIGPTIGEA